MIRFLENCKLSSDLDCDGHNILGLGDDTNPPGNLVADDDPRLTDQRNVPDGSVTNAKVNVLASIQQSKLNLNGLIPPTWIGNNLLDGRAAQGDLVERVARRGANNGYAPLNSTGVVNVSRLPSTGPASGTVTVVDFSLPRDFNVTVPEITTSGSLTGTWKTVPDQSWFGAWGTKSPGWHIGQPFFVTAQLPDGLIPNISASKFTSGVFDVDRVPVGTSLGVDHAPGLVPDTLDASASTDASDYLARDLSWKRMITDTSYQPMLPGIVIELMSYYKGQAQIRITSPQAGSKLFYLASASPVTAHYTATDSNSITILVDVNATVKAYASKAGYNNSDIVSYMVPTGESL